MRFFPKYHKGRTTAPTQKASNADKKAVRRDIPALKNLVHYSPQLQNEWRVYANKPWAWARVHATKLGVVWFFFDGIEDLVTLPDAMVAPPITPHRSEIKMVQPLGHDLRPRRRELRVGPRRSARANGPARFPAPPNEILAGRPVPTVGGGHQVHRRGRRGAPEPRGGVHALDCGGGTRRRRARGAEFYPAIGGPPPLASEIGCCFETLLCNRI